MSGSDGLAVDETPIPGLLVVRLDHRPDSRGWFEEAWQREKMTALGVPDFGPVQSNISWNAERGATRGVHAEPWDKFVTVTNGRAYAAWVDLRSGGTFGTTFATELEPGVAVFVPRGVGNSYQTLDDATAYTYLVNDHWRPGLTYTAVSLDDPALGLEWPVPLADAVISDKDRSNPVLADVVPMAPKRTLVIGCRGQLGRALLAEFPDADGVDLDELDLTDPAQLAAWPWQDYAVVLNAAGYTAVDAAETTVGRAAAWAANASAPASLSRICARHRLTLVHYSTEYVFDGTRTPHTEDEPLTPLGVYAQSKAAGEIAVAAAPRHFLLRTSWVIGDGHNFVRTMQRLAAEGVSPSVVADQVGRLTFTDELSRATRHLLDTGAAYGTYQVSNGGPPMSWAEIASEVFALSGRSRDDVHSTTTAEYAIGREMAPRPLLSSMDLAKLVDTGFEPRDAMSALMAYCSASRP